MPATHRTRAGWIAAALALLLLAGAGYGTWTQLGCAAEAQRSSPPVAAGASSAPQEASITGPTAYPRPGPGLNLLALEASPYLQLHAHNPVDWYPWGEAAFARARAEGKPVFLSVGYSTCFWCHVMERNVFSDPEIAAQMNEHFVSIKVDREERPDVDEIYMQATRILNRSGGWPNSVFLTPDAQPFFAGTYFPPEDGYGRPGFPSVLKRMHEVWTNDRQRVLDVASQVTQRIAQLANVGGNMTAAPPVTSEVIRRVKGQLRQQFDAEHGGFGGRTKFPRPPSLDLLLTILERERDPELEAMLVQTLDAMALGGIHDHLAGGFHRYSTEPTWSIPHFEKMLYDNAQLLGVYARAYALTKRPLYREVVERTAAYLDREMSHPEGGFMSAQDAEVDGEEGASYVWTRTEIEQVLGEVRAAEFLSVYELAPMSRERDKGVLRVQIPVEPLLEHTGADNVAALLTRFDADRAALLARRDERVQPLRDDKVLGAWNGLAIRGLVEAANALESPEYLRRAERSARFVLARLLEDGELRRSYVAGQAREYGVLDDYAFLADGLLALHRATGDSHWQTWARRLSDIMLDRFQDPIGGGFFLTPEGSDLLVRPKPFEDNALPSGNAAALRVLRVLAAGADAESYRAAAAGTVSAAAPLLQSAPYALSATVAALARDPGSAPAVADRKADIQLGLPASPAARESLRLPGSEDYVRASLVGAGNGSAYLVVRLAIDEGWHVNANPASFPFLIPTQVEVAGDGRSVEVRYPPGRPFRPRFSPDAISVYEGTVDIPVVLADPSDPPERLELRFQACDAQRCLPPAETELLLGNS